MNLTIYALLVVSTTFEFLRLIKVLPGPAPYAMELLQCVVLAYVLFVGVQTRFQNIRPQYVFAFGFLALVMLCGTLANSVEVGPAFAGVRTYVRAIPLFFLPAVFVIRDRLLRRQFALLLFICLLQFPIAISQRWHNYGHLYTSGDRTFGTMMLSGWLSIFLICAACVLTGLYMRKRISGKVYIPMLLLLLAPTTINETKVTLFMVPIGLIATFVAGSNRGVRVRNGVFAIVCSFVFVAVFVPVYDLMEGGRNKESILSLITSEKFLGRYMETNVQVGSSEKKVVGRWDSVVVPLHFIAKDPATLAFGVGPGNASLSSLGPRFNGRYMTALWHFIDPTSSKITAELGILGLFGALLLNWFIFRDSRYVADTDREGLTGALAVGWTGVVPLMMLALFYTGTVAATALSVCYWYFSGVIAARRAVLEREAAAATEPIAQTVPRVAVEPAKRVVAPDNQHRAPARTVNRAAGAQRAR